MLEFYEEKGRRVFVRAIILIIVVFSFTFIIGEFVSFRKDVLQMEADIQIAQQKNIQKENIQQKEYSGQLEYIEGNIEKRSDMNAGWFSINKSDVIRSGDELRTLSNSRAIITIEDGSTVRLNENTHIIFNGQNEDIVIVLNEGFIYNNVAKNNKRIYTVKTGDYEIKALGTEFSVANNNEDIDVIVVESAVHVSNKDMKVAEIVKKGNKIKIKKEDKIKKEEIIKSDLENDFLMWSTFNEEDVQKKK